MDIQAKIKCVETTIRPTYNGTYETVKFQAVASDSPENKTFCEATPSLELSMMITNPSAMGQFIPGKEYKLLFSPAE